MKKIFNWMRPQSRHENLIYLVMWGVLFAAPLVSHYVGSVSDESSTLHEQTALITGDVMRVWRKLIVYLVLFLIHNFLLAPLIIYAHKRVAYFSLVAVLVAGFTVIQCSGNPQRPRHRDFMHPRMEQEALAPEWNHGEDMGHRPPFDHSPMEGEERMSELFKHGPHDFRQGTPPIFREHDVMAVVVLILMFGANLGLKGYFRSRNDQKRLAQLEKQNLEQQLEYLRYQINPHFFMNTLNNIHALVDIDPAKAQETIVELSKMMRFVLYEGDKHGVPLSREFEFIRTYIKLMQLRFTDKVRITVDLPAEVPDKTVPPLMLISFIENAFKHGVSYKKASFIEIKVEVEGDSLHFSCRNTKAEKPNEEKGGVGLANVRKRLNLLFDHNYTLRISDGVEVYDVDLVIPLA